MLKKLFEDQRRYLNHFLDHINLEEMERIYQLALSCSGLMIFTGVGKSGIIAEKIAMTLSSTGTRALYLPPLNFLHGDIGIISANDLVFMLSKSGETEELLNLVPFFKKRSAKLVAIVSHKASRLSLASDLSITLPVEKELCPFNLAPTTSTTVQLLFGDALAIALMQAKKFDLEAYAQTHPAGAIGKKMTLLVEDIMLNKEDLPLCYPEQLLRELLRELSDKKCGSLLVVDKEDALLGIFTDGDLRRALQQEGAGVLERPIGQLMTQSAISVFRNQLAWEAMQTMQKDPKKWIMVCPVLEGKKLVGIIRMHDIVHSGLA